MQQLSLLIVDDEAIIIRGLRHMVREAQTMFASVLTATDAFEALDLIAESVPDLVMTDIQMPEMDGLEFIAEAKQRHVKRFVVLTGYDRFDYAREALRLHVNDYLLKPIQHNDLMEVLNRMAIEILEERRTAPQSTVPVQRMESAEHPVVRKFRCYIENHFMYDISLDDVATHLSLHPNYVCNVLKKEADLTFVNFLQRTRTEKAKELLVHPDAPTVEQVAKSVGYENSRNFYKVFKKHTGMTPGEFRAEYGGGLVS